MIDKPKSLLSKLLSIVLNGFWFTKNVSLVPKPTYHQGDFSLEDDHLIKGQDFTFTGIGLYTSELFRKYNHSDLGDILREEKNISSSIFGGYWEDIGTPERLENARSAYNSL